MGWSVEVAPSTVHGCVGVLLAASPRPRRPGPARALAAPRHARPLDVRRAAAEVRELRRPTSWDYRGSVLLGGGREDDEGAP